MWYHAAISLERKPDDNPKDPASPKAAWIVDFGADEEPIVHMTIAKANDP